MTDFYCEAQFWLYISFGIIGKSAETLVLISFDIKLLFIINTDIYEIQQTSYLHIFDYTHSPR